MRPEWLILIPVWAVLAVWMWRRRPASAWHRVCDPELIPFVVDGGQGSRSRLLLGFVLMVGFLSLLALAGPVWRELPRPVYLGQSPLVVVLDLSASMSANDVRPSRLARARMKVLDLLEQRRDGQTALIVYAGDAFTVTPLTDDTDTIAAMVPALQTSIMPSRGSRADRAIAKAADLLRQAGGVPGQVLVISDGVEGQGMENAVSSLVQEGHRLSLLGVGSIEGAPVPDANDGGFLKDQQGNIVISRLDEASLRVNASMGRGEYARLTIDDQDIERVLAPVSPLSMGAAETELKSDQWREEGPWLVLLVLILVLPAFRKGVLS